MFQDRVPPTSHFPGRVEGTTARPRRDGPTNKTRRKSTGGSNGGRHTRGPPTAATLGPLTENRDVSSYTGHDAQGPLERFATLLERLKSSANEAGRGRSEPPRHKTKGPGSRGVVHRTVEDEGTGTGKSTRLRY